MFSLETVRIIALEFSRIFVGRRRVAAATLAMDTTHVENKTKKQQEKNGASSREVGEQFKVQTRCLRKCLRETELNIAGNGEMGTPEIRHCGAKFGRTQDSEAEFGEEHRKRKP